MDENNIYATPTAELERPGKSDNDNLATRWARLWGSLIDGIIAMAVIFPVMYITGFWEKAMTGDVPILDTVLHGIFGFIVFIVLHGYLLFKYGQTIGKRLVGTRIVSASSNEVLPLSKVIIFRYLPISIAANIPAIGQFLIAINYLFVFRKNKRCLHDLIAGTKVVKASAH
ncbi:MAG: RDD family protein [Gammaproteobacteria bacterium]|nr:RDD family protein [Gammaproteobacteria bacterium]